MSLFRTVAPIVVLASAAYLSGAALPVAENVYTQDIDRSVKPGDDFYRYANGGWLARVTIPSGQSSFDTRAILTERTGQRVRDLIQGAAVGQPAKGSVAQKVGAYYASFMDEEAIEAKGLEPLAGEMATISAITDKASLSTYLGSTLNTEVDGLTSNADHIFGVWVNQGFEDSQRCLFHLWQGGLGMPDRDAYLDPSPKMAEMRAQYQTHIAAILKLASVADSETKAARILALEVRIAQAHAPDSDAADVFKQNNPWKRADFDAKAPGIDWNAYFKSAGVAEQPEFIVWQPSAVVGTSALVGSEVLEVWKDYLRFHLIEHYASVLPKAITAEDFAFYGATLSGAQQPPDRTKLAIAATNAALGQAVGQLYTQRYFPPEAKLKAQAMVADLIAAYRVRISNLTWMSPQTKEKALAKLAALRIDVGYPDTWIGYSTLDVVRGDAFGNMRRAEAFNRSRNLAKLKQPADPDEWRIDPQIVGAVIVFTPNTETFSAGLLQPPYFDPQGDSASNYGSAGAGMAHEITHSFDELGNIYDAQGRLGNWWTTDDASEYHASAAKLAAQFDGYCPLSGLCVNGKQVLTENIADLAGLLVAHDAYVLSLKGKTDTVIDGLTGEQRFFLAFAQRWRKAQDEAALRRQIKSDTHSPGQYRSDTVRNVDAWYTVYEIAPVEKLYLKPEERVSIW
ncbi:MAG TPA: M13 family metallopeptidase [Candidatus Dormibacteraeota bacterium]|nr:M13 family metallopeptidase [Candidatus Dormibacteraeota bacterium]